MNSIGLLCVESTEVLRFVCKLSLAKLTNSGFEKLSIVNIWRKAFEAEGALRANVPREQHAWIFQQFIYKAIYEALFQ